MGRNHGRNKKEAAYLRMVVGRKKEELGFRRRYKYNYKR